VSAAAAHVVGVDIGTQSTKAVLCAADGTIVAQASRAYAVDTPQALWAEQRAEVWLVAVAQSVRELVERAGVAPGSIAGLCVSSLYGGSGIPVDGDGVPIHPCLIWMDRRAQEQVDRVRRSVDLDRLYDITGNGVDSYYGYTKMLWLRDERPEVWQRTHALLPPNSYVALQMTGEVAVDHSSAGNIGGIYDVARRSWSDEMLGALGIARSLLPDRLVDSSEVVGALRSAWADRLGLRAGTPVVAGGVDAAVATLAAGASRAGNHVAMIGTSMCWGTIRQSVDARHGLISMPHVVNGKRDLYVFGGAITAGASVTWFRETFCQAEIAAAATRGSDPHLLLEQQARDVPPGARGVLFLPYLMGERSPIWDAKASGAFLGLGLHHGRGELYRAVLEGVSFALRHNIETGARGGAALDEALTVVGGAARSDLWLQIIADVTGRPVVGSDDDAEASLGAAMLAALGTGVVADAEALRGWVHTAERARPAADALARYDAVYAQYLAAYPALRPVMHALRD